MRAVLKLEHFAEDFTQEVRLWGAKLGQDTMRALMGSEGKPPWRPWVARITGLESRYGLKREFVHGTKDYSQANSIGSRGVYEYFALSPGVYEVSHMVTWRKSRRYFLRVTEDATTTEITREEAIDALARC